MKLSFCGRTETFIIIIWSYSAEVHLKFGIHRMSCRMSKFEGKTRISRGVDAKKVENSRGVIIKLIGNLGGQLEKNNILNNRG